METSTQQPVTTAAVGLRYGLLSGLVYIIYMFGLFALGQEANTAAGWVGIVIPITFITLGHRAFKQANGGFMSYGQGLSIGMLQAVVSGVMTSVFNYVYREFVDPDMNQRMLDTMRAKFEEQGQMSDAQIDQAVDMTAKFSQGLTGVAIGMVMALVFGLLLSLVISAITKNARPEFE